MSVFSRNAVLPEPGLDTRLTTKTPASWKRWRSSRATHVVLLQNVLPDFDHARCSCGHLLSPQFPAPRLPVPGPESLPIRGSRIPGRRTIGSNRAVRGDRHLGQYTTIGNFFDDQAGSFETRPLARQFVGGKQRVLHDAGQRAEFQMHRVDAAPPRCSASSSAISTMLIAMDSSCIDHVCSQTPPARPGPG